MKRAELESRVATAALAVEALQSRIEELKQEATVLGYDLVAARAKLREETRALMISDELTSEES
jgi:hypothetical protein